MKNLRESANATTPEGCWKWLDGKHFRQPSGAEIQHSGVAGPTTVLLAMPNFAAHLALLPTDLATTFARLLHTHYRSTPQAGYAQHSKTCLDPRESRSIAAGPPAIKGATNFALVPKQSLGTRNEGTRGYGEQGDVSPPGDIWLRFSANREFVQSLRGLTAS